MEGFTSKALLANLACTFVEDIRYDPKYNVFLDVYSKFPALKKQIEGLLKEVFHPYKNDILVLEDLRSFFLKNLTVLLKHPYRRQAYWLIFDLLFKFFNQKKSLNIKTAETIFSVLEKTADLLDPDSFYEIIPIFKEVLRAIVNLPDEYFLNFLENYYSFKKLIIKLKNLHLSKELEDIYVQVLKRSFYLTYNVWEKVVLKMEDTLKEVESFFGEKTSLSQERFKTLKAALNKEGITLEELLDFPDHLELLREVKELIHKINRVEEHKLPDEVKIKFLFALIEAPILRLLHEELIREVNRTLMLLIKSKPPQGLDEFIIKFFKVLKQKLNFYPWTALECIKNIGITILKRKEVYLIEILINEIIKFGFQPPEIRGIDPHWKIKQNKNHLLNIRTWLEIFKVNPEWCSSLLAALILNLRLYGVAIKDTDLFQRDITQLLNSNIKPVYNLVKQFCRLLPVYYNEIGAEGLIRDISTEIDEIFSRKDSLIYFLRKLVHIENSSLAVELIKRVFKYWWDLDPDHIKGLIPEVLWERVVRDEIEFARRMHELINLLKSSYEYESAEEVLSQDLKKIKNEIDKLNFNEKYKRKLYLLIHLYQLEYQKYFGGISDLESFVTQYQSAFPFVREIEDVLSLKEEDRKIEKILDWLKSLKEVILSPQKFTPVEEILLKRHVAVDIPSMYGRYREKKFDAMGLSFRLEHILDNMFSRMVEGFELRFITRASFFKIFKILKLFRKALEIDGIFSQKFDLYLNLLESSLKSYPLTFDQYMDIFRGLIDGVQHIIKVYYVNPFLKVFPTVFVSLKRDEILSKYKSCFEGFQRKEEYFCVSEKVVRDIIDSAFVIKHLDAFLKKIYSVISSYLEKIDKEDLNLLMSYDPRRTISFIHQPNPMVMDLLYLGNKGYNLLVLANEKGLNVKIPYGFILTTEIFRCYKLIKKYDELWTDYKNKIERNIRKLEQLTRRNFGKKINPLLLSVRSGSAISMPGMMNSILNVGINLEVVEGLIEETGNEWFAWDTYRRFIQSWAMAFGIPRDFFNNLMRSHKRKYQVKKKREFTGEQMRELALTYKKAVEEQGIYIMEDPWEQLFKSVELIFESWFNQKATSYRELMQIAKEWGTAVIVQQMVFGNKSLNSGTGVTLTTSPVGKFPRIILWGDYTPYNQGEDIVSGLVNAFPISLEQKKIEGREGLSLEEAFPKIYESLLDFVYFLVYEKGWGHQEIEFTFESDKPEDLYILQVRDIILREGEEVPFFNKELLSKLECIGKGIGVCGGLISGRIVFTLEDIEKLKNTGDPLILLRYDTVPDNIKEISMVDGILTARGGQTSHAAIVASRLGKICVVGCESLSVNEFDKEARFNGLRLKLGEWITLNGITGQVFKGKLEPLVNKGQNKNL